MKPRKSTNLIVIHCSATQPSQDIGVQQLRAWHKQKGWADIGYHLVIRRNGVVENGRGIDLIGAHVEGHNATSIGICMVGGINRVGVSQDNFTPEQYASLDKMVRDLLKKYPNARVCGHRDLSPDLDKDGVIEPNEWVKMCPSFSVSDWLKKSGIRA